MDVDKRIESAATQAVRQRNYRRARERALTRLAHAHPEEYQKLREEELERDQTEGKTWISIRGRAGGGHNPAGRTSLTPTKDRSNQANSNGAKESYVGGEE
jgi:hypothetical protein